MSAISGSITVRIWDGRVRDSGCLGCTLTTRRTDRRQSFHRTRHLLRNTLSILWNFLGFWRSFFCIVNCSLLINTWRKTTVGYVKNGLRNKLQNTLMQVVYFYPIVYRVSHIYYPPPPAPSTWSCQRLKVVKHDVAHAVGII